MTTDWLDGKISCLWLLKLWSFESFDRVYIHSSFCTYCINHACVVCLEYFVIIFYFVFEGKNVPVNGNKEHRLQSFVEARVSYMLGLYSSNVHFRK